MADNFTPITLNSQEDVDHFMADRLARARRAGAEEEAKKYTEFAGYKAKAEKYDADISAKDQRITELEGEKNTSAAKITELEGKIREYETNSVKMRIARETGLPAELAERLSGTDEAAMRADAEALAKLIKGQNVAPMYKPGGEGGTDAKESALRDLLKKLKNEE